MALLLNAGHFIRNERAFGSVAPDIPGIHAGPALGEADHSINALLSNMARSAGSHFVAPSDAWNSWLVRCMYAFHEKIGRDINDANTTWLPLGRFLPYQFW